MIPVIAENGQMRSCAVRPMAEWDAVTARVVCREVYGVVLSTRIDQGVVHLYPQDMVTSWQEVKSLQVFMGMTDARIAWHAST